MSLYENYEEVCKKYDEARVADGADIMCAMFTGMLKKPMSDIKLLEAGCGTGNYSLAFMENGLRHLSMFDASQGMLECARQKTIEYKDYITCYQLQLPKMQGIPSGEFDVVTFVMMLHHLDAPTLNGLPQTLDDFPNWVASIKEAHRVMKPGGVLLLDVSLGEILKDAMWWIRFCPKSYNLIRSRCMTKENILKLLKKCGFGKVTQILMPGRSVLRPEIMKSIERISDPDWRNYVSEFRFVERTGELESLIERVQSHIDNGTIEQFKESVFESFEMVTGDHTMFICQKLDEVQNGTASPQSKKAKENGSSHV